MISLITNTHDMAYLINTPTTVKYRHARLYEPTRGCTHRDNLGWLCEIVVSTERLVFLSMIKRRKC